MEMNWHKILVSGAALLMLLSTGAASAGKINVNARRRTRTHRTYHRHASAREHRKSRKNRDASVLAHRMHNSINGGKQTRHQFHHKKHAIARIKAHKKHKKGHKKNRGSKAKQDTNDGLSWYYSPKFQSELAQPAAPSDPGKYLQSVEADPKLSKHTKSMVASLMAGPVSVTKGNTSNSTSSNSSSDQPSDNSQSDQPSDNSQSDQPSDNSQSDQPSDSSSSDQPSDNSDIDTAENYNPSDNSLSDESTSSVDLQSLEQQADSADKAVAQKKADAIQQAEQQAEQQQEQSQQSAAASQAAQDTKLSNARALAQNAVNPISAYDQVMSDKASDANKKLDAARALVNAIVAHTDTVPQAIEKASKDKKISKPQRAQLSALSTKATKAQKKTSLRQKKINFLRQVGYFKGMSHKKYRKTAKNLKRNKKAMKKALKSVQIGAVIYSKDPQNALKAAKKAAQKNPALKSERIYATNNKTTAAKIAALQADYVQLAKQQGIKLPSDNVVTINVQ